MKTNLIIGWSVILIGIAASILFVIEGGLPGIGNLRAFIIIPFAFIYGIWCLRKAHSLKAELKEGEKKCH